MVRDGYYYGFVLLTAAFLIGWLTTPGWAAIPVLLALFFLWFFRDPDRIIPDTPGAIVSPADGKVTAIANGLIGGRKNTRISIFLNVFDVHVNRSPISGIVRDASYRRGKFLNAMNELSAAHNEQNVVEIEGEGQKLVFKQIAGLLARRIVFTPKVGDRVARGERIGMMKFGSRMDVIFDTEINVQVRVGDRVRGGESVLAYCSPAKEKVADAAQVAASEKVTR